MFHSVLATLLCAASLLAQTTSTEVLGTITDATGAVVPGAEVTLLRIATGEKRQTRTDGSGNYSFPLIEIGDYTVTVTLAGFKTQPQTGINVAYQQKARVSVILDVGAPTARVA